MAKALNKTKKVKAKMRKAVKHSAKRTVMVKRVATKATKKMVKKIRAKSSVVGKVVHYYDRIGVAVLELTAPVSVGEFLTFRRGENEFTQPVTSLQIDHHPVERAGKGKAVGMKVNSVADRGTVVLRA